jgi:ATP-dependent DNA helicase 2 subunit 2
MLLHTHQSPIMPDRAGYQVSLYAIDVSASMGELIDDPTGSSSSPSKKTKLDYVKEFVARKCEPKVCI